jgi:hypothetical protein
VIQLLPSIYQHLSADPQCWEGRKESERGKGEEKERRREGEGEGKMEREKNILVLNFSYVL